MTREHPRLRSRLASLSRIVRRPLPRHLAVAGRNNPRLGAVDLVGRLRCPSAAGHLAARGLGLALVGLSVVLPTSIGGTSHSSATGPTRSQTVTAETPGTVTRRAAAAHGWPGVVDLPRPAVPHPQAVGARTTGTAQLSPGQWVRPGVGILTSPFGMRWGKLHKGIDLGGPYGSPIYAASDGVVTFAGFKHGYHRYVMVDHGHGLTTAYAHMSATYVHVGQHVRTGEQIAREGTEGTGPHLHFEVWRNGRPVNPIPILRRHGVYI